LAQAQQFYEDWESGQWGSWVQTGTQQTPPSSWTLQMAARPASQGEAGDNRLQIKIYDVSGRLVRSFPIVDLCNQNKSVVSVYWDSRDNSGNGVRSGVYFCRLIAGDYQSTKKLLLLR
jgi:flagellar hook assembly protein FlgD